ncbi:MAG: PQQ-dependent sugar dehydrogenase [Saprospiraceae bacterium]|nr:PQQ-dependent sugar dehydrogenase [Saprospiraceae bacterium]
MKKLIYLSPLTLLIALWIWSGCQSKPMPIPSGDPNNAGLFLPDGFEALAVVDSIGRTRHIAVNDHGDIYVKLTYNDAMKGSGGTVGLRDLDGDGKADSIVYFGDYKDEGSLAVGVQIHDDYLYTTTVKYVLRNKLKRGELIPTSPTEIILTDTDTNVVRNWHTTKPLAFDDQGHMFVPFGAPNDACQDMKVYGPTGTLHGKGLDPCPVLETHAGIWRFDANKKGLTIKDGYRFATGLRSVVGMTWNPGDKSVYAVVNGIDNFQTLYPELYTGWQAALLPSEIMAKVQDGDNYGWPYAYYDQLQGKNVLQPGYGGDGKIIGRASEFTNPVFGFPGHWAPMDILFYQGNHLPERYKKGAFVAFHGSTDRSPYPQAGYIVCFIPFENGKPTGAWEVFADGFTQVDTVVNTSEARFRPMGLAEGPDGSLYISESNKGKIWRVMYPGDKTKFTDQQLVAMEARKSRSYIKTPDEVNDNLQRGDRLKGSILYQTYCKSCHQQDGKGDNNRYPPLAESEWVKGDVDQLIDIVLNGRQGPIKVNDKTYQGIMPKNDLLDDHAIASIITYIRAGFKNRMPGVDAKDVARVRRQLNKK